MTDTQPIINAALASAEPSPVDAEGRYVVIVPAGGTLHTVDPIADKHLPHPRRASGTSKVYDVESLASLWTKHAEPTSELFADEATKTLTGVLNADAGVGNAAGHRDHRVVLELRLTEAWNAWKALDGKLVDQHTFAEHIEDRVVDVQQPSGAEMLELAQSFEASTSAEFKSATPLASGARALRFEETVTARAGQTGNIEIPASFVIAVQPFEGGPAYRITARFRYRIREGRLAIGYRLERPNDVLREAFNDVAEEAATACETQVLRGTAPPAR